MTSSHQIANFKVGDDPFVKYLCCILPVGTCTYLMGGRGGGYLEPYNVALFTIGFTLIRLQIYVSTTIRIITFLK